MSATFHSCDKNTWQNKIKERDLFVLMASEDVVHHNGEVRAGSMSVGHMAGTPNTISTKKQRELKQNQNNFQRHVSSDFLRPARPHLLKVSQLPE